MSVLQTLLAEPGPSRDSRLWLVIVPRGDVALHAFLGQRFAVDATVQVLKDHRVTARRRRTESREPELRWADRRRPAGFYRDLRFHWSPYAANFGDYPEPATSGSPSLHRGDSQG